MESLLPGHPSALSPCPGDADEAVTPRPGHDVLARGAAVLRDESAPAANSGCWALLVLLRCRMLLTFLVVLGVPARAWKGLSHQHLPPASGAGDGAKVMGQETISAKGLLPGLPKTRRGEHGCVEEAHPDKASPLPLKGTERQALPWPMSPAAKRPAPGKKGRKVTLSLDVPTHVLSTLLELAREKELQAKAAANAELMARLGRRR
ncbi:urocortin-3-like [Neopsephotus bourkii]|uniref:urocortin-3-like n=1 Tax=Neopsephotus bourkii TaxID=309878 RepID=UPI002AA51273|nr:urocortin-3-like [Neopsephotus bourkii]